MAKYLAYTNLHGLCPTGPLAASDGHDAPRLVDEFVPGLAAVVDDVVVGLEDAVGQPVVAHELPDVLDRVELGALGGQRDDADVFRHFELASGMPSGLIHQHDGMGSRCDGERYFGEVQSHGFGIAEGQNEPGPLAKVRAYRAKDVGRLRPLVLGRRRPGSSPRPAPRDLVFLAHPGLVLEPDLYGRAFWEGGPDLCQLGSETPFLKATMACSFWAWWRGELHVAQLLQLPADIRLIKRDGKFVMEPLDQNNQAPAHDPVDRRDRATLDNIDQRLTLRIVEPRTWTRRLAIQKSIGTAGIEPDHPVPHDLKPNAADPRGCAPAAAVVYRGQGQQPTRLVRALRRAR